MTGIQLLKNLAKRIRSGIITSTTAAGSGHPTSSLSATELTTVLFFGGYFKQNTANFQNPLNDKFILSKGHAAPLLYSLYEASGILSQKELLSLRKFNSHLQGHPTPELPFVDVTTGSLGQGLSVGLGMAFGIRLKIKELSLSLKREPTVWVLLGDSEMAEGQVWEAMEVASHYHISNLIGIIDINRLGQSGETNLGWDIETYKKRIETFGWNVFEIHNGHNIEEIQKIYTQATRLNTIHTQKPTMIIARTIKGKGVPFLEDKPGWHGKAIPKERLQEALKAIGPYDRKMKGTISPAPIFDTEKQNKTVRILNKLNNFMGGSEGRSVAVKAREIADRIYEVDTLRATREAFGDALADLGKINPRVVALDAEVGNSTFTERLKETNPSHFFQMFIDEENMVSVGLGLSKLGYVPYVSTFAAFLTRAYDQIRMAQYSLPTLNIIGSHAGCSIGQDGVSQMALEDISMMRSIRESTILYPGDAVSAYKLTHEMANRPGINYLRTTREKTPLLYKNSEEFPLGGCKIHSLKNKASDALIIAAGITLHEALKAQKLLEKEKIYTTVIDLYSVKPLDEKTLRRLVAKTKKVIVVEDHYEAGGIGDAILSVLSNSLSPTSIPPFIHLCVRKEPRSGTPQELLRYEEIDAQAIMKSV